MSQDRFFKPWVTNISRTLIKQCKINIQHVVYNENAISVSQVQETTPIEKHGGAWSNWRKKIAVVTNFSQFTRPPGKRVSEADLAHGLGSNISVKQNVSQEFSRPGKMFRNWKGFFRIVSKTLLFPRCERSSFEEMFSTRQKSNKIFPCLYLASSFLNFPRASTTVYNRTLKSWTWVSFFEFKIACFQCVIHKLHWETLCMRIVWYSVSMRAGGLAVNKKSKQRYSESVASLDQWFSALETSDWGAPRKSSFPSFFFSNPALVMCLWGDRQTYHQWENCTGNWRKRRGRTGSCSSRLYLKIKFKKTQGNPIR